MLTLSHFLLVILWLSSHQLPSMICDDEVVFLCKNQSSSSIAASLNVWLLVYFVEIL